MTRETIYRMLATRYGWTPNEIADMTPHQQIAMLKGDDMVRVKTLAEAQALIRRFRGG